VVDQGEAGGTGTAKASVLMPIKKLLQNNPR
jgi:hypothetical protein